MPASNAIHANGLVLECEFTTGVYTAIAELLDVNGPNVKRDVHDVTHMTSPGKAKEYISGLIDYGELKLDVNWIPTEDTHDFSAGMCKKLKDGGKHNFKIKWPDAGVTTFSFGGIVTTWDPSAKHDAPLQASFGVKISGDVTWA